MQTSNATFKSQQNNDSELQTVEWFKDTRETEYIVKLRRGNMDSLVTPLFFTNEPMWTSIYIFYFLLM